MKLVVYTVAASLFLAASPGRIARACSPPACSSSVVPPTGSVPGNALVIPVTDPTKSLSLVGPDGVAVPLLPRTLPTGEGALAPAGTLPSGSYTLSYDETCPRLTPVTVNVLVSDASDYPTTIGRTFVSEAGVAGSETVFADLSLEADQTFLKFVGLSHVTAAVDGVRVSDFNLSDQGWTATISAVCGPNARSGPSMDSCGGVVQVVPGTHRVTFSSAVTGAPTQPLGASVDVKLDCAWLQSVQPDRSSTSPQMSRGCAMMRQEKDSPLDGSTGVAVILGVALALARTRAKNRTPRDHRD